MYNCLLQQLDSHLHGHNDALANIAANHVAVLATRSSLFLTQQVAGREVLEAVVVYELAALCAFTGSGTAQNEDNRDVGAREEWAGAVERGELLLLWLRILVARCRAHCGGGEGLLMTCVLMMVNGGLLAILMLLDDSDSWYECMLCSLTAQSRRWS